MLQLERQKLILEYLKQNRKATTNELSEMLGVSTTTIRTDLNQMDKEKLLTKTHGGALYHDNSADNKELTGKAYFFHERALENKKEKGFSGKETCNICRFLAYICGNVFYTGNVPNCKGFEIYRNGMVIFCYVFWWRRCLSFCSTGIICGRRSN